MVWQTVGNGPGSKCFRRHRTHSLSATAAQLSHHRAQAPKTMWEALSLTALPSDFIYRSRWGLRLARRLLSGVLCRDSNRQASTQTLFLTGSEYKVSVRLLSDYFKFAVAQAMEHVNFVHQWFTLDYCSEAGGFCEAGWNVYLLLSIAFGWKAGELTHNVMFNA